jgi:prefoldin subunit 5
LGISIEEAAERIKKRYDERQRILQNGTKYLETLEQEEKGTGTGRY